MSAAEDLLEEGNPQKNRSDSLQILFFFPRRWIGEEND